MTQRALTTSQDQTPTTAELTARDVFSIWLADQGELTRTVYESAVWRGLRQDNLAAGLKAPRGKTERSERIKVLPLDGQGGAGYAFYQIVLKDRLTVLHAKSGAGKTSLLNVGLSPRLIREGRLPVYARAYEDPVLAIKRTIAPPSLGLWPELLPKLPLHEFLGLTCAHLSRQTQELVIILDQFEEFFVFWPERDHRQPFIDALTDCYEDKGLPIREVLKELVSSEATKRVLRYGTLAVRVEAEQGELDNVLAQLVDGRLLHRKEDVGEITYFQSLASNLAHSPIRSLARLRFLLLYVIIFTKRYLQIAPWAKTHPTSGPHLTHHYRYLHPHRQPWPPRRRGPPG